MDTLYDCTKTLLSYLPLEIQSTIYKAWNRKVRQNNRHCKIHKEELETGCIFIHIPKNAGVSISKAIYEKRVGHRSIRSLSLKYPSLVSNLFTFAVKRNPYARILSAYKFLKQGGFNEKDKSWAKKNLENTKTFEDFLRKMQNNEYRKRIMSKKHFRPQVYWVTDPKNEILVDKVFALEKISQKLNVIETRIGKNINLKHKNKSTHKEYSKIYNEEMKNVVQEAYSKDFDILNYNK